MGDVGVEGRQMVKKAEVYERLSLSIVELGHVALDVGGEQKVGSASGTAVAGIQGHSRIGEVIAGEIRNDQVHRLGLERRLRDLSQDYLAVVLKTPPAPPRVSAALSR